MNAYTAFFTLLAVGALSACSHVPNESRTGAFATDQLTVAAQVEADDHYGSRYATVNFRDQSRELFVGEGDALFFLAGGNQRQAVEGTSVAVPPRAPDDDLRFLFARDGREYSIPLPLAPRFSLVVPSQIRVGDTVAVDLQPRPALSPDTKISFTIEGSTQPSVVVSQLPWVWDTSKLRAAPTLPGEPAADPAQFAIRIITEVETKTQPFTQGPFSASSKVIARRTATTAGIVVRP